MKNSVTGRQYKPISENQEAEPDPLSRKDLGDPVRDIQLEMLLSFAHPGD
jgi:hypothetical protein